MVALYDLLNHNEEQSPPYRSQFTPDVPSHGFVTSNSSPDRHSSWLLHVKGVPRCRIHKRLLALKSLVQLAIRRKSGPRSAYDDDDHIPPNPKLHIKSLEAGLRVKLTMSPSLLTLYKYLTPHINRRVDISVMVFDEMTQSLVAKSVDEDEDSYANYKRDIDDVGAVHYLDRTKSSKLLGKLVQLIDSNLVNLSKTSKKVLLSYNISLSDPRPSKFKQKDVPTFNSLLKAVQSLFGVTDYTLIRVTRSTTTDYEGSVLLKLESAKPGDLKLLDDNDFLGELTHSIGTLGSEPSNLFMKKVVARPRYKSDMKIFLIPKKDDFALYVDERMFERDLINGVIDFDSPLQKKIYATFPLDDALVEFRSLLRQSQEEEVNARLGRSSELAPLIEDQESSLTPESMDSRANTLPLDLGSMLSGTRPGLSSLPSLSSSATTLTSSISSLGSFSSSSNITLPSISDWHRPSTEYLPSPKQIRLPSIQSFSPNTPPSHGYLGSPPPPVPK